jgi:hypothetical protein
MKVTKAIAEGIKEMKCSKTGKVLPLSEFRIHSKGYYLSYCKEWEKAKAKMRREAKKAKEGKTSDVALITITTPKGKEFTASTEPIVGGRKAESEKTDIVLYFGEGVSRDEVRSAFRAHTGVPMTGIKAGKVTA